MIPESEKHRLESQNFREELGLTTDFQVNGFENLLPAHTDCNNRKRDTVMHPGRLRYFLELAARHTAAAKKIEETLRLEQTKSEVLFRVSIALESGILSFDDLHSRAASEGAFRLGEALELANDTTLDRVAKAEVDRLLDTPVLIGKSKDIDGLTFGHDDGRSMLVRTCRERRQAFRLGFFPLTNFAMKLDGYLGRLDAVLAAVERGRVPIVSYIRDPRAGVADLDLLPTSLLPLMGEYPEEDVKAASLGALLSGGRLVLKDVSSSHILIEWDGWISSVTELLRADLDGDGVEEILVDQGIHAIGGSLGFSRTGVLGRREPNAMFEFDTDWTRSGFVSSED